MCIINVHRSRTIGNIKQENNYILENTKVLNNPKGKPVLLTLLYIVKLISKIPSNKSPTIKIFLYYRSITMLYRNTDPTKNGIRTIH